MKRQHLLRLIALLICALTLFALCLSAFADFGDFGGDDDYGGGYDDGGYDWGGGYDGGYDGGGYDWGDSDWSSSGGGSGGGIDSGASVVFFVVFLLLFITMIIIRLSSSGSGGNHRSGSYRSGTYRSSPYRSSPYRGGSNRSGASSSVSASRPLKLKSIEGYSSIDPGFSASKLKQKLSNLYIQMQQCWQAKDIESLRPYFTDTYFSQLDRQLDSYRKNGVTNYIDRPVVLNISLEGYRQEDGEDHIFALVKTRIVDYKLEDRTGRLVSGSRSAEKFMTYRYHLTRPTGQVTDTEEGVRSVSCPHCGAPVSVNESAKCPFCGSLVTAAPHHFVISQIEGISQTTR